jgi:hypothetical protein
MAGNKINRVLTATPKFKLTGDSQTHINKIISNAKNNQKSCVYYVRKTQYTEKIIRSNEMYIYRTEKSRTQKDRMKWLWMFRAVKQDSEKWVIENPKIVGNPITSYEPEVYQDSFENKRVKTVYGTDISQAYWRIAFLHGIIGASTYNKGQECPFKDLKYSTLSLLGAKQVYQMYRNEKFLKDVVMVEENVELKRVYEFVKRQCTEIMYLIKKALGNDFVMFQTDEIFYRNRANVKKVENILLELGFDSVSNTYPISKIKKPRISAD